MKTISTLLLMLSFACIPEPELEPGVSPEGEGVAVELARLAFARVHGPLPQHRGKIVWTQGDCVWFDGACHAGAYQTYTDTIYVVDKGAIWRSALAHELAHYWLDQAGDSDHDHSRNDWWDMVPEADAEIRAWEDAAACALAKGLGL